MEDRHDSAPISIMTNPFVKRGTCPCCPAGNLKGRPGRICLQCTYIYYDDHGTVALCEDKPEMDGKAKVSCWDEHLFYHQSGKKICKWSRGSM